MLKTSEDEELIKASLECLQLSLYRIFRFICVYGNNPDSFFSVSHENARSLFDALYKINEYDLLTLCSRKQRKPLKIEYEYIREISEFMAVLALNYRKSRFDDRISRAKPEKRERVIFKLITHTFIFNIF